MKKKILFYNWDPLAGPAGGGVTNYLTELISQLIYDINYEIWFLNSGRKYTIDGQVRLEQRENLFGTKVRTYEIINSPILSPGRQSIINIRKYLEDKIVYKLCKELIKKAGGFDIIHYQNLEGLSLKVLTMKKDFPNTKYIYTFHNYFPICTQVNLWKNNEINCTTTNFAHCWNCYDKANYDLTVFRFQHIDIPMLKDVFLEYSKEHPDKDDINLYKKFREQNIMHFNRYIDVFLPVSLKTKEILVKYGLDENKMKIMYVGSDAAKYQRINNTIKNSNEILHIIYLGYMRKDKGFHFFLNALRDMDGKNAKKIAITIVVKYKTQDDIEIQSLISMEKKFHNLILYNGFYDYNELEKILSTQDLGIVPILWEDNLPRIAIEQIAFGVPILSSDLGGVSELSGNNPDFIFKAGDKKDFLDKLKVFVQDRKKLDGYWKNAIKLTTMEEHLKELKELYNIC